MTLTLTWGKNLMNFHQRWHGRNDIWIAGSYIKFPMAWWRCEVALIRNFKQIFLKNKKVLKKWLMMCGRVISHNHWYEINYTKLSTRKFFMKRSKKNWQSFPDVRGGCKIFLLHHRHWRWFIFSHLSELIFCSFWPLSSRQS